MPHCVPIVIHSRLGSVEIPHALAKPLPVGPLSIMLHGSRILNGSCSWLGVHLTLPHCHVMRPQACRQNLESGCTAYRWMPAALNDFRRWHFLTRNHVTRNHRRFQCVSMFFRIAGSVRLTTNCFIDHVNHQSLPHRDRRA